MASQLGADSDRRGRSREKLATLVRTRSETLSLYTELANQRPFEADEIIHEALQEFCQALIDYAASAHFQLYRFISDRLERRSPVLQVADRIYPRIVQTKVLTWQTEVLNCWGCWIPICRIWEKRWPNVSSSKTRS